MYYSHTSSQQRIKSEKSKSRGFTLPEALISLTIIGFLSAGLTYFMKDVAYGLFWGTQKIEISQDVRSFTMRIAAEARSANSAIIYSSFKNTDRDQGADRRDDGLSGDCLVLVNTEPYPNADSPEHYTRVIVYFRKAAETENIGPVRRLEWPASGTTGTSHYVDASGKTIEELLTSIAADDTGDYPVIVELSRGMADGRLFTNFRQGKVIVVNGEILHGNQAEEVTNTYNLSISPRG
ncbi:type II secretion system protein [Rubellicoccus peritrichatus]|uniref:Type II secretion system protein n=1 Tax=Rubellicoccus peritrichatus TaxID=3080537 RepID=A0AAQ3L8N0_9BACT|nr:type II secretion system protein [Puniceicoccus sp. CR14]WOO39954.1 type II secretion system protein [Puniceicoccus sp. CR14]